MRDESGKSLTGKCHAVRNAECGGECEIRIVAKRVRAEHNVEVTRGELIEAAVDKIPAVLSLDYRKHLVNMRVARKNLRR